MAVTRVQLEGTIEADGHLRLDVATELPAGHAEITLTIRASNNAARFDFSDLIGRLQWRGSAVAQQRELRDEW